MASESGELKTYNPQQQISTEIILEVLIRHRDSFKQARTGELPGIPIENIKDNNRKMNQVRALNLIISAQREMITISRPNIYFESTKKWKKKYKEDEKREENPFKKEKNDYNELLEWLDFLKYCGNMILQAEKSISKDDDFILKKNDNNTGEEFYELTKNFYGMLDDLESSYEQIYLLMLTNKIVSAGIEEDEELEYKEKEQAAIDRIVNS